MNSSQAAAGVTTSAIIERTAVTTGLSYEALIEAFEREIDALLSLKV